MLACQNFGLSLLEFRLYGIWPSSFDPHPTVVNFLKSVQYSLYVLTYLLCKFSHYWVLFYYLYYILLRFFVQPTRFCNICTHRPPLAPDLLQIDPSHREVFFKSQALVWMKSRNSRDHSSRTNGQTTISFLHFFCRVVQLFFVVMVSTVNL